ncbi:MAG: 3-hydroxyisobutyrate dehydrogenase [Chloroflexi bacterium]|jgi:3-hydroxyisobutyrate dehydrogenase|nr:MAG: 3-hydroxyisobutyrate dehydrogenase [Chloroflexota bacterium]
MPQTVGFIGIGTMGSLMSKRILNAGFPLVVFDTVPENVRPLEGAGATVAASPREVAAQSDVVLLSLPNSAIVERVCFGDDGVAAGAKPGAIVVDLTSGNPPDTTRISQRLAEQSIRMVDIGLLGSTGPAKQGKLGLVYGGDAAAFEEVKPILDQIGDRSFNMGAIGNGHFAKALNNLLGTVNYLAACEAFIVAAKAGLDPAGVAAVINSSGGKSQATERRIPEWLKREFGEPGSGMALDLWIKDVATACGMGKETNLPMPLSTLAYQLLIQITNELGGNLPNNAIPLVYEKWAGVELHETE